MGTIFRELSLRDFLDAILAFIGAESLTDDEYDSSDLTLQIYSQETYDFLADILAERDAVSDTQDRLTSYFTARGVDVDENDTGSSNIYIGSVLE